MRGGGCKRRQPRCAIKRRERHLPCTARTAATRRRMRRRCHPDACMVCTPTPPLLPSPSRQTRTLPTSHLAIPSCLPRPCSCVPRGPFRGPRRHCPPYPSTHPALPPPRHPYYSHPPPPIHLPHPPPSAAFAISKQRPPTPAHVRPRPAPILHPGWLAGWTASGEALLLFASPYRCHAATTLSCSACLSLICALHAASPPEVRVRHPRQRQRWTTFAAASGAKQAGAGLIRQPRITGHSAVRASEGSAIGSGSGTAAPAAGGLLPPALLLPAHCHRSHRTNDRVRWPARPAPQQLAYRSAHPGRRGLSQSVAVAVADQRQSARPPVERSDTI